MRVGRHVRDERGYSLLELLIILAVFALAAVVTMPQLTGSRASMARRSVERTVTDELRQLRNEAIRSNRVQWLQVASGGRSFATSTGRQVRMPDGVSIAPVLWIGGTPPVVRFYPDGRSSGCSWRVDGGGASTVVTVDWLTGRVHTRAASP